MLSSKHLSWSMFLILSRFWVISNEIHDTFWKYCYTGCLGIVSWRPFTSNSWKNLNDRGSGVIKVRQLNLFSTLPSNFKGCTLRYYKVINKYWCSFCKKKNERYIAFLLKMIFNTYSRWPQFPFHKFDSCHCGGLKIPSFWQFFHFFSKK